MATFLGIRLVPTSISLVAFEARFAFDMTSLYRLPQVCMLSFESVVRSRNDQMRYKPIYFSFYRVLFE